MSPELSSCRRRLVRACLSLLLMAICISGCVSGGGDALPDISHLDLRDGDLLLQHLPGRLGAMIADITESQYSHCGIVVTLKERRYVLEAIGPVCYTPVREWIRRGHRRRFAQFRPRNLTPEQINKSIAEARKFLHRPYDIQYEWDEEKIYCSELVYKAYQRGAGIEIGRKQALRELKWQQHEEFISCLAGGEPPLERVLVTPEAVSQSPHLKLLYSNFPPRKEEPLHNTNTLTGAWRGDYTIANLEPAQIVLVIADEGKFNRGFITTASGDRFGVKSIAIKPFANARNFTATMTDSRGITTDITARIRDNGRRITGTWKDSRDNSGIFSLKSILGAEESDQEEE